MNKELLKFAIGCVLFFVAMAAFPLIRGEHPNWVSIPIGTLIFVVGVGAVVLMKRAYGGSGGERKP